MKSESVDYSSTLNLPKTDFPMKANLAQREPEIQKFWADLGLYRRLLEKPAPKGLFILHDGPPYSNGDIHIGTALQNKVPKDIIVRYRSMCGYRAPYVPGWDNHGMPIENNVTKEFQKAKKKPTKLELRQRCREYAAHFVNVQRQQFMRLGINGDWENPYLTMSPEFEARIVAVFGELVQGGYIYRGLRPIHWCTECQTALAEAEIEYADKTSPSIYVRFPLRSDPKGIFPPNGKSWTVIWTTTPWTIPANLAVAVHPEFDYVIVRHGEDLYLVAKGLLNEVASAVGWEQFEIVKTLKGAELEGMVFGHPLFDRNSPVVMADYVTLDAGTGVVHTAPGHGREDFMTGRKYGLDVLCPVDETGRFTGEAGPFAGLDIRRGDKAVISALAEAQRLLAEGTVQHSYPHCWRCHSPVIFRATVQWFMNVDHADLRRRALEAIQKVKWYPPESINRITSMVANRPDWCLSRQRAWGVGIPVFYCRSCGAEIITPETVQHICRLVEQETADVWYARDASELVPPGFKCPNCGAAEFTKEEDILDVWFDSGSTCRAVLEGRPELRFPADLYLEGHDQHRGWFNSSLMIAMATKGEPPYRAVITNGFTVDERGRKMSKSLGNVIHPLRLIERYGADVLRLAAASFNYFEDIRLGDEALTRVADVYRRIRNTFRFLLGNLYDFDPARDRVPYDQLLEIDRWALHRLQELIAQVTEAYEAYEFHPVYYQLNQFCAVDMSAFYLDVLKDRLYASPAASLLRRSAQTVFYEIANVLARIAAPVLVHTAEEVWQHLRRMAPSLVESVHLSDFPVPNPEYRDDELAARWKNLLELRDAVNKALEQAKNEGRISQPLEAMVRLSVPKPLFEAVSPYKDSLASIFIVSKAELEMSTNGTDVEIAVEPASGEKCARCWLVLETVGCSAEHPKLCHRCVEALKG
jgi:isoleucyl-tRNA synthetase